MQDINRNFSDVIDFLDHRLSKTRVHLVETPCYFYRGKKSKLEVTVFANPQIAKIDIRTIAMANYDREPVFECSYDLKGLSMAAFQRHIDEIISQI